MSPTPLDLNDVNGKVKVEWSTVETGAEEAARLAREDREHVFQVRMRWALFAAAVVAVAFAGGVGAYLALQNSSAELARLGVGILTAVVTGALGFLSGRASAGPSR
jgi:hypothetical protein